MAYANFHPHCRSRGRICDIRGLSQYGVDRCEDGLTQCQVTYSVSEWRVESRISWDISSHLCHRLIEIEFEGLIDNNNCLEAF